MSEPERALYVVEAGANDFFVALAAGTSPATLIGNGVNNTLTAIHRLTVQVHEINEAQNVILEELRGHRA